MDRSSPSEIRSQVGYVEERASDSDAENKDPHSSSQVKFATQLPQRRSPDTPLRDIVPLTAPTKIAQEQHDEQAKNHNDYYLPINAQSVHYSTAEFPQSRNLPSTATDMTQRKLFVPPSSESTKGIPSSEKQKSLTNGTQSRKQTATASVGNDENGPVPMPEPVSDLLKRWRKESHDDRYIPRRLQVVPKDQAKLLESDDRWQPPLVGHGHRPGTVPLALLNSITQKADAVCPPSADDQEDLGATRDGLREVEDNGGDDREGSNSSSDSGSEISGTIPWSQSPSARPALPPDSPPLVDSVDTACASKLQGASSRNVHVADVGPERPRETITAVIDQRQHDHDLTRGGDSSPSKACSLHARSKHTGDGTSIPPSTACIDSDRISKSVQKTVQVKRTPHHAKEHSSDSEIPDSSTNVIPGTFDEQHALRLFKTPARAAQGVRDSNQRGRDHVSAVFEIDSSEDETVVTRKQEIRVKPKLEGTVLRETLGVPNNPSVTTQVNVLKNENQTSSKRKIRQTHALSYKRVRGDDRSCSDDKLTDADYASIDGIRMRDRRAFMTKIRSKEIEQQSSPPTCLPTLEPPKRAQPIPLHQHASPLTSPAARHVDQVDTSDTHASIHHDMQPGVNVAKMHEYASLTSQSKHQPNANLFTLFKETYEDYGGHQKQFDAACQLLRKLQLQGRATHPSLWDDFLFRHFHDYREHLQQVMESCGNALPYEVFYEKCIEQPSHLRRIVRPEHINALSVRPASTRSSLPSVLMIQTQIPPVDTASNIVASFDKSVAAESSVSNIKAVPGPQLSDAHTAIQQPKKTGVTSLQDHDIHDPRPSERNDSRSSRASVKIWLERAAGAESPLLGTPEVVAVEDIEVPAINLDKEGAEKSNSANTSIEQKKNKRTLPWKSSPVPLSSNTLDPEKYHSSPLPTSMGASQYLSQTPSINKRKDKSAPVLTLQGWKDSIKCQLHPSSRSTQRKVQIQSRPLPNTTFAHFANLYNNLPNERQALDHTTAKKAENLIDIFAWRS